MEKDEETTGKELVRILKAEGVAVSSLLHWRKDLDWTTKETSNCQMIHDVNKEKKLNFVQKKRDMTFDEIIYADETMMQIETHWQTCTVVTKKVAILKPKHPLKVHDWAGISRHGKSWIVHLILRGK